MTLLTNHLGFTSSAPKACLLGGPLETEFVVRDTASGEIVFRGDLTRVPSDFGVYTVGRFDALTAPGTYVIEAARERSHPFRIAPDVYDATLRQIVGYFTLQRCGDTDRGWNGPCHLDDGVRGDTLVHQDVTGGWHDACDLRKWVEAILFGMLGLGQLALVKGADAELLDELRWGNSYFLKMQEPAGYIMNYVGGDYFVHADNNRWTDNVIGRRDDRNGHSDDRNGHSDDRNGHSDDRVIDVRPCNTQAQWRFVMAEATMAGLTRDADPEYAQTCEAAARRCLAWLAAPAGPLAQDRTHTAGQLGEAIGALLALHALDGEAALLDQAVVYAGQLLALQVTRPVDSRSPVWGFFWERRDPGQAPMSLEPFKASFQGCWPLLGLTLLLEKAPDHPQAGAWRAAVASFCRDYLAPLAARNAFGMVPFGLYRHPVGGDRQLGKFWYRWFMEANPDWYVGINANLASTGVGLAKAARLLGEPEWAALAQRQLDWILGVNPFDASTVMGAGYNNPQHMFGGEFYPPTPFLPGAVMNGISGNEDDEPQLRPGQWQETEYWTPMVAFTMWLMAELGKG